jgi:ornithine cyclodeaminase/alanine dehydrogenase
MRDIVEALDTVFRLRGSGKTEMPPKMGVHTAPNAFIHAMPASVQGVATGMKWVSGYPTNIAKGMPYITGLLILNDPDTGLPIAVMDCSWITAMRTGASAAISAKYLARPHSSVAAFLGCGVQARASLTALVEVIPALQEIHCCDISRAASQRFVEEMSKKHPNLRFRIFDCAESMAKDADVVVTAIPILTHPEPPLDAGMLKEGGLAISLDYDSAWTSAAMQQCIFVADDTEQLLATKDHGTYFRGIPSVHADLGELATGLKRGRASERERVFSMNMGIAVEDMATARLVVDVARQRSVGMSLPL